MPRDGGMWIFTSVHMHLLQSMRRGVAGGYNGSRPGRSKLFPRTLTRGRAAGLLIGCANIRSSMLIER